MVSHDNEEDVRFSGIRGIFGVEMFMSIEDALGKLICRNRAIKTIDLKEISQNAHLIISVVLQPIKRIFRMILA